MPRNPRSSNARHVPQVRIIGGQWRSRRFPFPDAEGLRPTSDRVRETLFNWLMPYIPEARILDPFAGSGALLLEALSRHARLGLALEMNPQVATALRNTVQTLQAKARVLQLDALQYLQQPASEQFDVVFLDPPYRRDLLVPACQALEQQGWLAQEAWIYTESESAPSQLALPDNWRIHRERKAGQIHYALWQRDST